MPKTRKERAVVAVVRFCREASGGARVPAVRRRRQRRRREAGGGSCWCLLAESCAAAQGLPAGPQGRGKIGEEERKRRE